MDKDNFSLGVRWDLVPSQNKGGSKKDKRKFETTRGRHGVRRSPYIKGEDGEIRYIHEDEEAEAWLEYQSMPLLKREDD